MAKTAKQSDVRFDKPLYTIAEAASYLVVPRSTFETWVRGYERHQGKRHTRSEPIVTSFRRSGRGAEIPFIGLAEGMVGAAFRRSGVSMQHIRRALLSIRDEIGLEHALASKGLYTDGAQILYDFATKEGEEKLAGLTVVVSRQRVFAPVIKDYLKRITYAGDGWAQRMKLPISDRLLVDPKRAFGQPIFVDGGVRLEDVLDRFKAGDSMRAVAHDFGVPVKDVEEVIRGSLASAA